MRRIARLSIVIGLSLGLAGCQSFNIRSDWDPSVSFEVFQRYFWAEPPEVEGASPFADNTLLRKRVRFGIEAELARRGFVATEEREGADFVVTYSVILEERIRVDGYSTAGRTYRRRYSGFGIVHSSANVRTFQESTLIVDFRDTESDDLLWRGWGSGILRTRDRDRGHERLTRGIEAILAAFPPKSRGAESD